MCWIYTVCQHTSAYVSIQSCKQQHSCACVCVSMRQHASAFTSAYVSISRVEYTCQSCKQQHSYACVCASMRQYVPVLQATT